MKGLLKLASMLSVVFSVLLYTACTPSNPTLSAQTEDDARVLGIIMTVDQNEMTAATLAQKKHTAPSVKAYAAWLYAQHDQNLRAFQQLSQRMSLPPRRGKIVLMLENQGKHSFNTLSALDHRPFDRAYINDMIKGHKAGLQLIDNKLLKLKLSSEVRKELVLTRTMVANHLKQAQLIHQTLDL